MFFRENINIKFIIIKHIVTNNSINMVEKILIEEKKI